MGTQHIIEQVEYVKRAKGKMGNGQEWVAECAYCGAICHCYYFDKWHFGFSRTDTVYA